MTALARTDNDSVARPRHAPVTVTNGNVTTLTYDANGNMLTGLDGKIMTYDGENRPLSVRLAGKMTCYVYGADGTRLKKIENLAPAANRPAAPSAPNPVTADFAEVEIRRYGQGAAAEKIVTFPVPAKRPITNTPGQAWIAPRVERDRHGRGRADAVRERSAATATAAGCAGAAGAAGAADGGVRVLTGV